MIALSLSPRQEAQQRRQTWLDELQFLSKSSLRSHENSERVSLFDPNTLIIPSAAEIHNILSNCEILIDDDEDNSDMISWSM